MSGILHGVRLRKNFKTREEAAAEKAALEIKALQSTSGLRSIATALTEERVREAEALFQRVNGKSHPLSFYVDFALANYREPDKQKTLAEGMELPLRRCGVAGRRGRTGRRAVDRSGRAMASARYSASRAASSCNSSMISGCRCWRNSHAQGQHSTTPGDRHPIFCATFHRKFPTSFRFAAVSI